MTDPCLIDECNEKSDFRAYGCLKWFILGLAGLLALGLLLARGCMSDDMLPGGDVDANNGAAAEVDTATVEADAAADPDAEANAAATAEADANAAAMAETEAAEAEAAAAAEAESAAPADTIVSVAQGAGGFATLLAGAEAAGLVDTLQGEGPFTVFAPTDEAFGALPDGAIDALLANPEALTQVLSHHVVPGMYGSADIGPGTSLQTAAGTEITIGESALSGTQLAVDTAGIDAADVTASNGVIHVIDSVLLPIGDIQPPVIDEVGVATFKGPRLIIVGIAEPGTQLLVELNGDEYGRTTVEDDGTWLLDGEVGPNTYNIIAYTLDDSGLPLGISKTVILEVTQ